MVVQKILTFFTLLRHRKLTVKLLWVPSHASLRHSVTAYRLAKESCRLSPRDVGRPLLFNLQCISSSALTIPLPMCKSEAGKENCAGSTFENRHY